MTLDSKHSKDVYQGNGSTTAFPFAFKVWNTSQITVTVTDAAGVSTDVTSNSTVTLTTSGGSVTYPKTGSPLPSGAKLAITRNMPFTQGINLTTASRFDPQVLEDGLDQATAERQQIQEQMARAVILPATSNESPQDVVASIYASRDAAAASASTASAQATAAQNSADMAAHSAETAAQTVQMATADAVTAATTQANAAQNAAAAAAQSALDAAAAVPDTLVERVTATETKNTQQDTRLDGVESKNTQQDMRLTSAETGLAGKANVDLGNATGNAIGFYLHARDVKTTGTHGGTATGGAWNTRDLNTVVVNRIAGASISSNRITLPPGKYIVRATAPCSFVGLARIAIYNYTTSAYEIYGMSEYAVVAQSGSATLILNGELEVSATTTIELRMWAESTYASSGCGVASGITGVPEYYSEVQIWKV